MRVLLADLLEAREGVGRHPRAVCGDVLVELRHPEWIGGDRGHHLVLVLSASPRASRRAGQPCEFIQHPEVVPRGEHERWLLVDLGEVEHGGRRRLPCLERRHAPFGRAADPSFQRLSIDQPPRFERQGQGRAPSAGPRTISQRGREALVVSQQQEHRGLARPVDLDRPAPGGGALEPALDRRIDRARVEIGEQFRDPDRARLDGGQPHRPGGTVHQLKPDRLRQRARERGLLGPDQDPAAASAIAAQLDVVGERRHRRLPASCRSKHDFGQRVAGIIGESQPRVTVQAGAQDLSGVLVDRQQSPFECRHAARARMLEQHLDQFPNGVGGKAEPPVVIRAGEVDQQLTGRALGATALESPA